MKTQTYNTAIFFIMVVTSALFSGEVSSEPEHDSLTAGIIILDFNFNNKSVVGNDTSFSVNKKVIEIDANPQIKTSIQSSIAASSQAAYSDIENFEYEKFSAQKIRDIFQDERQFVTYSDSYKELISSKSESNSENSIGTDEIILENTTVANTPSNVNIGLN